MRHRTLLPPPPLLLVLLLLLLLLQPVWRTRAELLPLPLPEPASGLGAAPQPARGRIKAQTENMSTGDSFNIRHGRSRAHMLHTSSSSSSSSSSGSNSSSSNSTRLTLVSDVATLHALPLPTPTTTSTSTSTPWPTVQPGGAVPPVTHKIRKLHKKKINESIRKSVDKSLGLVRAVKNHRSLAEAEHLQGRPTDVEDTDSETAALSEVMQLADEIDLENSLESAYQNVVVDLPGQPRRSDDSAASSSPGSIDVAAGRQFVRANGDDANYDDSAEEDELSTTEMATFAPRQPTANGPRASWQLQQARLLGRTRLLPVNQSNSRPFVQPSAGALHVNFAASRGRMDYQLESSEPQNNAGDDEDFDEDEAATEQATAAAAASEGDNSTELSLSEWPESEGEERSQTSTRPQAGNGMVVKQINFNYETGAEPESETESESESVSDSESESNSQSSADSAPVLDTSEVTMDDGYPPEVLIDDKTKPLVIDDVEGDGEGVDSNQITADVINARDSKIDLVSKFLQYIEQQHLMGSNCVAGTSLNLGEGVVDRYAQDRFRVEAEVAVNRANMLTRIFKTTAHPVQEDVNLLHASVLSMVEFDDDIFAAGNCFDWNEHPAQPGLFCPFAYRLPPPNLGAILAKDLAMEYHYLGNTSEWFFLARKNAERVIARNEQYLKSFHLYSNRTEERVEDDTLAVKYEDGRWSKPYYDCGGGNIWMLTYTVPFFGYENGTYHFKGTSGIDIDLRRVDIDQCPQRHTPGTKRPLNIFAGTDKCKQRTTMCEPIMGLGFRRGSYKCLCRKGFYFPDVAALHKFFNGSLLEEEYEKLMLGKNSTYNSNNEYECLPCAEGCDSCEDASPCIAALNWPMRSSILALACIVIGLLPPAAWFTFRYQQVKVVRAASPALLRVIALGAFFIYCTNIVMYPNPSLYTCTARIWLREIGFSLTYGALMLKTWRISVIFRVRSAKAVKITDAALLKRLGIICGAIGTCLLVRTLVSPPDVVVGRTADDLKAFLCKTDWWDYTFTSMEVLFLAWGVRLCIMVRKAPSEFNESRFISMAIYNEFLLTCFLNVSMLFLQSPANPDLLYIIFFCHTQLTVTLLLALIFGSKVYIVLRSGKSHQENIGMGAKASGAKFNFRPQVRTFAHPSSVTTSTAPVAGTASAETKLSDQEALEEIRQLSVQLQRIQEMAPPKGVAVMTISSLLDGLKTPGGMMMVAAAATHASSGHAAAASASARQSALPLLTLNAEMQKYNQQLQQNNNANGKATTAASGRGSIPTMVLETPPSSATPTPTRAYEERAMNTELSGDDFREQLLRRTADGHIICSRCLDASKEHYYCCPPRSACEELGSPQQEGSISFANIKLDCMCSQSDDLDQGQRRRPAVRTAATNTPPTTCKRGARNLLEAEVSISYQICDNCRSKYRLSDKPAPAPNVRRRSGSCTQAVAQPPGPPTQTRSNELLDRTDADGDADTAESGVAGAKVARSTDDIALYKTSSDCEPATRTQLSAEANLSLGNVSNTSNNSTSQTDKTSGSGAGRPKRPDKLMLDLNDRSKYTKEVSV